MHPQISDIPSVDQCLDYESVIACFPKIRLALAPLRGPIRTSAETAQKYVLNATSPPEAVELLCIVYSTTEFQPFANHPVILDVRTIIDMERISKGRTVVFER